MSSIGDKSIGDLPLVSVVIPSYNAEKYLAEAIDSVLGQTYPNIELIVLDDGSTDHTKDILKSYPDGLFYWESHSNMGQSATLNKGWAIAKGEFLSYLSADDSLLPDAVASSVEKLLSHKSVVMTYCDYMLMDEHSKDIRRVFAPEYDYKKMVGQIIVQPGPGVLFRREAFEKIGGWDISYKQVPDLEYWLRLGLQGDFLRVPMVLAKYRVHDESQTYAESSVEKAEECIHMINSYFQTQEISDEILALEGVSKGSAYLFVARMHLRSGRYRVMFKFLTKSARANPGGLFSKHAVRMIGNGILFRLKRLFRKN